MVRVTFAALLLALAGPSPGSAAAEPWSPDPPRYDVAVERNHEITMRDGTVLRADVYRPIDRETGRPAEGPFPVILSQTPYTKTRMAVSGATEGGEYADPGYFVPRGYLLVIADVRGTGGSEGQWQLHAPQEARDGAELVRWAARLPQANGRVGLLGASYGGSNQIFTAAAVGRNSPLKAIFPVVAANHPLRDFASQGGIPNGESTIAFLAVTAGLNTAGPAVENPSDLPALLKTELQHLGGTLDANAWTLTEALAGGERIHDEAWWQARAPQHVLEQVVRNRVPAFLVGGWLDVFQRGAPLNYSGLQNAAASRTAAAPMRRRQRPSGRYQLLMGPWHHLNVGEGLSLKPIQLRWFDRWLKGRRTGIERTRTPLHLHEEGTGRWVDVARYPFGPARSTTYYLGPGPGGSAPHSRNDGRLSTTPPAAERGADQITWMPASSICSRPTSQFSLGFYGNAQCERDDRTIQVGPGALTYTTEPLAEPQVLAGPVSATLYATSTRPDTQWVVTVEDVAPDGTSTPRSSGALIGSQRALDRERTWWTSDGRPLLPHHPLTRASRAPVAVGEVTRYDVEVFPTFARIDAGHRIRVTITTADTPHLLPTPAQIADLTGGIYELQRTAAAASSVELPLAPPGAFSRSCAVCETPAAARP